MKAVTSLQEQAMNTPPMDLQFVRESYVSPQAHVQQELARARTIQQGLLPHQLPASTYFQMHAFTMPCSGVGGDYYDMVALPGNRCGFTVADVSGKGLPAAILSANLEGIFAAIAADDLTLPETLRRINNFLYARLSDGMYATMFYGVLNAGGDLDFVNAGHTSPFVVRGDGSVQRLEVPNFPLGLFPGIAYEAGKTHLDPGDLVLLFSDGLTEAQDFTGDLFGELRLTGVAKDCARLAAADVSEKILKTVRMFVGSAPPSDDLTLVVVRFGPQ